MRKMPENSNKQRPRSHDRIGYTHAISGRAELNFLLSYSNSVLQRRFTRRPKNCGRKIFTGLKSYQPRPVVETKIQCVVTIRLITLRALFHGLSIEPE